MSIPIGYMGLTVLRLQTAGSLRELKEPTIVLTQNQPVAALVPYDWYLLAQKRIEEIAVDAELAQRIAALTITVLR